MRMLDELATVVAAQSFQLVDPATGLPTLDVGAGSFTSPYSGTVYAADAEMRLHHHDGAVTDSKFAWNVAPVAGSDAVTIIGPLAPSAGQPPTLTLEHLASVPNATDVAALSTTAARIQAVTNLGTNVGTAIVGTNGVAKLRTDGTVASGGATQLDANGTELLQLDTNGLSLGPPASLRPAYVLVGSASGSAPPSGSNPPLTNSWTDYCTSGGCAVRVNDYVELYGNLATRCDTFTGGVDIYYQLGYYLNGVFQGLTGPQINQTHLQAFSTTTATLAASFFSGSAGNVQVGMFCITTSAIGMGHSNPYVLALSGFSKILAYSKD